MAAVMVVWWGWEKGGRERLKEAMVGEERQGAVVRRRAYGWMGSMGEG